MENQQGNPAQESTLDKAIGLGQKAEYIRTRYDGVKMLITGIILIVFALIMAYIYFTTAGAQVGLLELSGGSLVASVLCFLSARLQKNWANRYKQ
jgi:hypothetical protein